MPNMDLHKVADLLTEEVMKSHDYPLLIKANSALLLVSQFYHFDGSIQTGMCSYIMSLSVLTIFV